MMTMMMMVGDRTRPMTMKMITKDHTFVSSGMKILSKA